jgi:acyl carrier protein
MVDIISSRTPDGSDNDCPVCGAHARITPSQPGGDAPCPNCGSLLWFFSNSGETLVFERRSIEPVLEIIRAEVAKQLGVDESLITDDVDFIRDMKADSLDKVELVIALEEEFDVDVSDEEAASIRTVADAIALLARRRLC